MALSVDRHREALLDRLTSRVEPPYAFGQLLVGNHEGRHDAHDIVAGRDEKKLLLQGRLGELGWRNLQLQANQKTLAADLLDHIAMLILELRQPLAHVQAEPRDPLKETWGENDVEGGVADRHRQGIAAERGPVDAGGQAPSGVRGREASRHRKARADTLRGGENIGINAAVLIGKEAPGAADAGLHFVEDQEEAMPIADLAQTAQERGRDNAHPALALDRLDHDHARLRPDRRLDRLEVGQRNLVEAVDLGAEAVEIFGLAPGGDHGERPAMERAFESEGAVALGVAVNRMAPARHLDRRLVGLGAGIGEENEVGEGRIDEAPGKALPLGILVQVRNMPEFRALSRQRFDEVRMGVADRGHGDARAKIEIALPGRRNEPAALASLESDLGRGVSRNHGGSRVGDAHRQLLVMSRETGLPRSVAVGRNKNAAPLGRLPSALSNYSGRRSMWSNRAVERAQDPTQPRSGRA